MTVLEIIQEVQRKLRMPASAALSDAHAKLILTFINTIQRDFMMEAVAWDECKVYSSFNTVQGTTVYAVTLPSGGEVEVVRHLQIGTSPPLTPLSDDLFREYKRVNTAQGQPLAYRIYGRSGGGISVELSPAPDKVYVIDYELLKKPPRVTAQNDVPLLDSDTIISGVLMLARKEQGEDIQVEMGAFQAKMDLQSDNQGESNWGDVEAV